MGQRGGAVIGSWEATEKASKRSWRFMNITRLQRYFSLLPLRFLIKNLNFKLATGDPRPSMVKMMIWGVIRLIAVEILAPAAERGLEQGE